MSLNNQNFFFTFKVRVLQRYTVGKALWNPYIFDSVFEDM